ncbi:MAG: lytic transglycosylase domain-containing protein [Nitrospirae bacterium]|nr:lytic transglycosylase domain-containing protein [Nitrospirota bacterium]
MKCFFIIFALTIFLLSNSYADIYKYIDENGITCYTDSPVNNKADLIMKEKSEIENKSKTISKISISQNNNNYHTLVHEKATKYKMDPSLVKAVIKVESNWNEWAVSRKGAMGLMQLMPATAREMNVNNPFNPEENIEGGVKYLRYLLERFNGDLTLALAAYNAGPNWIEKFGVIPPITETKEYVRKVLSIYNGSTFSVKTFESDQDNSEKIYKVTLTDGTVLFTNSTLLLRTLPDFK